MATAIDPAARACFELGIKFGSLYHQFAGTPVSPASADALARGIEASIENQPHCTAVEVTFDEEALATAIDDTHGYTELTGTLMDVRVEVEVDGVHATAELVEVAGYPEMRVTSLEA